MPSVNKVHLIGNLGRDPEMKTFPDGGSICNITIATTRRWKKKDSNEFEEETEWHRVVFRDRLAEVADEYLRKGRPVYVEGRLKTRKWQDKDGKDVYTTEIVAENMQLLGDGGGGRDDDGGSNRGRERGGRDDDRQRSQGNDRGGRGNGNGGGRDEQRNTRGSGNGGSGYRSNGGNGNGGGGGDGRGQQPKGNGNGYDDMDDDIPY